MQELMRSSSREGDGDTELNGHIVYGQWFLDISKGPNRFKSPSTNHLLRLVGQIQYYASNPGSDPEAKRTHREFVRRVDEISELNNNHYASQASWWSLENSKLGYRKYLTSKTAASRPSAIPERIKDLRTTLIPKLLERLEAVPEDQRDLPHLVPLSEVGYTSRPYSRRTEHAHHISTTWALALFEDIAVVEFPEKTYQWRYAPISECRYEEDHCSWLECFWSRVCQSYFWLGGFNPEIGGLSVKGWEKITKEVSNARLSDMDMDQIRANIASDDKKLKALVKFNRCGNKYQNALATIAELTPKIAAIKAERARLEQRLTELEAEARRKVQETTESMLATVNEAIETLELTDLFHRYVEELRKVARENNLL